ncbi:preprotein translocase subunit SecG [Hyphobacterium sp. CCMP332]|jgi:preprotein translocase subunit SecG|uniref:preprotein translocase subunit SecG n=1 Tax=Hyphobacterium sp. CCMP332 TaxID=2749086 RepID=UPI00164F0EE7|nr:preprotein translocase subunit SecG [Hyphobacterium sp. CCMP332]QNL18685.1 preprotein translocase subunit SecG [Hyphobacterium sp. CCMP332]
MMTVLLIIQLLVSAGLVGVVLMQRSDGGALGIGGGGGGMMSSRGAATVLTRSTTFLGAAFFALSIVLAIVAGVDAQGRSVFDEVEDDAQTLDLTIEEDTSTPSLPDER